MFSPLLLVIVAISSWALLGEKLYVGTYVYNLFTQIDTCSVFKFLFEPTEFRSFLSVNASALGSVFIVMGLYAVLWGKTKEMKLTKGTATEEKIARKLDDHDCMMVEKGDLELQSNAKPDGDHH